MSDGRGAAAPGNGARPGEIIRRLRMERNMTQKDLAGSGYSISYISAIERGTVPATPSVLRWCAQRLGVSVATVLGDSAVIEDDIYTDQALKAGYELMHAQMLVTGGAVTRGRAELGVIRARMRDGVPRALLWHAAYAAIREGHIDDARREAEAYLRDVETANDDHGRAAAHWLFGLLYAVQRDFVQAIAEYRRALEMEDQAYFDLDAAMTIRGELARLLLALGDAPAAAELDTEALRQFEVFADPGARAKQALELAEETARAGAWQKAYRFIRWAWLSQREQAVRRVAAQAYLRHALLIAEADGVLMERELRLAVALAERSEDGETRALAVGFLALTLSARGEAEAARQVLDLAALDKGASDTEREAEPRDGLARGVLLAARGWQARRDGDDIRARALADKAEGDLRMALAEQRYHTAAAYEALARLYVALGDETAALAALWQALERRR